MHRINRKNKIIPNSLTNETARELRLEIVSNMKMLNSDKYLNQYKKQDTKDSLYEEFSKKCCYCEKKLYDQDKHIEHYRPKSIYYWECYSYDNLLLSCSNCNRHKGVQFPTQNAKQLYNSTYLETIHSNGKTLNKLEEPLLINPCEMNPSEHLEIKQDYYIYPKTEKGEKTIQILKLNRKELLELRKEVFEAFRTNLNLIIQVHQSNKEQLCEEILTTIKEVLKKVQDDKIDYRMLREYLILNISNYI